MQNHEFLCVHKLQDSTMISTDAYNFFSFLKIKMGNLWLTASMFTCC